MPDEGGGTEVKQSTKEALGALAFGAAIALTILIILYRPVVRVEFEGVKNPVTAATDNGEALNGRN